MADRIITVTNPSVVTNDTLSGYNNYSDIDGQLGTTMTPTEATNGHTVALSDGSVHEVTTKPVGTTNGEFSAVVSNAVSVDLSGGGEAPLPVGALLALPSDVNNPVDLSASAKTTLAVSGYSLPVNSGGLNAYDAIGTNALELSSATSQANIDATICFEISFDSTTSPASTTGVFDQTGFNFGVNTSGGVYLVLGTNTITSAGTFASIFTAGVKRMVTIIRNTDGSGSIQYDDDTPLTWGAGTTDIIGFKIFGAWVAQSRYYANKIGRLAFYDSVKTGADLTAVKAWVADGTP